MASKQSFEESIQVKLKELLFLKMELLKQLNMSATNRMDTSSIYDDINTIEQQYKLYSAMQSLCGVTSESGESNADKSMNSSDEETLADKPNALKYGIAECTYAIRCIRTILHEFYNNNMTITQTIQLLKSLITSGILQSPANNPCFLTNQLTKLFDFETVYKMHGKSTRSCIFCNWLGLPQPFYSSHVFKNKQKEYKCPLYPFYYNYTAKFEDAINVTFEIAKNMNVLKYCENCKQLGKSKQMYMSHIFSLSNGNIVCPIFENSIEIMQKHMCVYGENSITK